MCIYLRSPQPQVADDQLQLSNQALMLAFNYFDRYLSLIPCPKTKLQLVSTACLWVASKVCSTECPVAKPEQLEKLIGIHRKDIMEMERWLVRPAGTHQSLLLPPIAKSNCSTYLRLCPSRAEIDIVGVLIICVSTALVRCSCAASNLTSCQ